MAHVLLPCDLPSWLSVQRHLALLKTCRTGKQLAEAMDIIFDLCSVSLDPDDAAQPLEGHPGNADFGHFVDEVLSETERGRFLRETLPKLAARAAELKRPPLGFLYSLRKEDGEFRVPRPLVSSLLANAFFSTFPKRNAKTHPTLQDFRMADFFSHLPFKRSHQKKLRAFLRYFDNLELNPAGDLKFTRKVVGGPSLPWWLCSDRPLVPLVLRQEGGVLDAEPHFYRACSCSPLIGGDVLKASTSKEARLFFSFPELLVLLSFVESLTADETLVAENAGHQGVNFCFLDSSQFSGVRQFEDSFLLRELNKALAAFQHTWQHAEASGGGMRRVSCSSHLSTKGGQETSLEDQPRSRTLHHKWHSSQQSSRSSMRTASQTSVEPLLRDDYYTADEDSEEGSKMECDVSRTDSLGFVLGGGASEDSSLPVHERLDDFRRRIRKRTRRRLSRRSSRSLTSSGSSDMEDISEDILSEGISEEEGDEVGRPVMRPTSSEPSIVSAVAESSSASLSQLTELSCFQRGVGKKKTMMVTSSNGHLKAYSYDGVSPNLPVPFRASFRRRKKEGGGGGKEEVDEEETLPPSVSRRGSQEDWVEEKRCPSRAVVVEPLSETGDDGGDGDSQLRVTLLWLAASMADLHALILYTTGHAQMREIVRVHSRVLSREWTVGDLSCEVLRFCRNRLGSSSSSSSASAAVPQLFAQIIGRPTNHSSSSLSQESLD